MDKLLTKLNYKEQERVCIKSGHKDFISTIRKTEPGLKIDEDIDPKFLYEFIITFVRSVKEIEEVSPEAIHNLAEDGILWFAYPKKTSKKHSSDITRDVGWISLGLYGFEPVRQVAIDEDWSALRFRNAKFIKRLKRKPEMALTIEGNNKARKS